MAINLVGNFTGKLKSIHCLFLKDDCCPKTFFFGQSWRKGLCSPVQACKACCNSIAGLLYIALFQACAVSHGQRALNMHPPSVKCPLLFNCPPILNSSASTSLDCNACSLIEMPLLKPAQSRWSRRKNKEMAVGCMQKMAMLKPVPLGKEVTNWMRREKAGRRLDKV